MGNSNLRNSRVNQLPKWPPKTLSEVQLGSHRPAKVSRNGVDPNCALPYLGFPTGCKTPFCLVVPQIAFFFANMKTAVLIVAVAATAAFAGAPEATPLKVMPSAAKQQV